MVIDPGVLARDHPGLDDMVAKCVRLAPCKLRVARPSGLAHRKLQLVAGRTPGLTCKPTARGGVLPGLLDAILEILMHRSVTVDPVAIRRV